MAIRAPDGANKQEEVVVEILFVGGVDPVPEPRNEIVR